MISWRWRNRARRISTAISLGAWRQSSTPRYEKLFIAGAPRSGTTWINLIFANHPLVITENESLLYPVVMRLIRNHGVRNRAIWSHLMDAYQSPVCHTVGVHRFVSKRVFRRILRDTQSKVVDNPQWADVDVANHVIRQVIDHFFCRHGGTDQHLFVEKTPTHIMYAREILSAFPEAKLLIVLRDGRDVCASLEARADKVDWAPRDRRKQIEIWKTHVEAGMKILSDSQFSSRIRMVRYEDVLDDPEGEVSELFQFAGLPTSPPLINEIVRQTQFRQHRNAGPGKHNNRGVSGNWQTKFSAADELLFAEIAGDVFESCGYRFSARRSAA